MVFAVNFLNACGSHEEIVVSAIRKRSTVLRIPLAANRSRAPILQFMIDMLWMNPLKVCSGIKSVRTFCNRIFTWPQSAMGNDMELECRTRSSMFSKDKWAML